MLGFRGGRLSGRRPGVTRSASRGGGAKRLMGIEGVWGSGCNIVAGRACVRGGEGVTAHCFRTINSNSNIILNIYIRSLLLARY